MRLELQFFGGRGARDDMSGGGNGDVNHGERHEISREWVDTLEAKEKYGISEFMASVEDANDTDFGSVATRINGFFVVDDVKGGVLGFYGSDAGLNISRRFMDGNANARYDKTVSTNYHPSRGDKSGIFAVMSHETGHAVSDKIAQSKGMKLDDYCEKIVRQAARATGAKTTSGFAENISRYAAKSHAEAVAEAFADVRCNGSKAKRESQEIYKRLKRDYKA